MQPTSSNDMSPSAPPADSPWSFGPEPVYKVAADHSQALRGLPLAPGHEGESSQPQWHEHRKQVLREWGAKREAQMHRPPAWCMDQLCSGSGLFPPRHLSDDWFMPEELEMIASLERVLQPTGHAALLARDMMALRIFDVDVRIVADDSGSMSCGMIGGYPSMRVGWEPKTDGNSGWTQADVQKVFGQRAFRPKDLAMFCDNPFLPSTQRWEMLKDALIKWEEVFNILQVKRKVYLLNHHVDPSSSLDTALARGPCGVTPLGSTFARVLSDHRREGRAQGGPLLILALTDGEASDAMGFNNILDEIQDGLHGDVQVCLMGMSLEPDDIAWFEDEECDDTRIRTIEAWEVEQQMILYRKVIPRSSCYNFAMHTYRALVTNFFPADYDYEAPIQTLRHRLYITLHALDRRLTGQRDADYSAGLPTDLGLTLASSNIPAGGGLLAAGALAMVAGPKGLGCLAGLGLCMLGFGATGAQGLLRRSGGAMSAGAAMFEESVSAADDEAIGLFVTRLQQQTLQGRRSQYPGCGGWAGGWQAQEGPRISQSQLRRMQCAIGTLSPSETQMRDLQFQDVYYNKKALEVALGYLRKAAA